MCRTVYGIGETICDIIFKEGQPQAAKPGGSTFNAMISLGRMKVNTSFISKIGDDMVGEMIMQFMRDNNVSTQALTIWEGHKTDIALAFLDEKGDANYSFYKAYDKQFVEAKIPQFKEDDILLFGSYFALNPLLKPLVDRVLEAALSAGCIIYYDPNFRQSHAHEAAQLHSTLLSNMSKATIVRGSDEDFSNIFGADSPYIREVRDLCPQLIITRNSDGVDVYDHDEELHFEAKKINPVSTIGAGDSFNAGFIFALLEQGIKTKDIKDLTTGKWQSLVGTAIDFSTEVCQSLDNYVSKDFALSRVESL